MLAARGSPRLARKADQREPWCVRTVLGGPAVALLSVVALGCGALGCDGSAIGSPGGGEQVCTLIGCEDQFSATVTMDVTLVPAGTHTVDVVADGAAMTCTFSFPPDPPTGGIAAQCSSGLTVFVEPDMICSTMQLGTATWEACQPIAGKFTESIWVAGTPGEVQVQQTVGGTVILDQTVTPTYQTTEPNGPGCGPTCHQAGAEWTIPQ